MKEIKFRFWDKDTKHWVTSIEPFDPRFFVNRETGPIDVYSFSSEMLERFTPVEFTGLKDKNGKEIYESDLVRTKKMGGEEFEGEVFISPTQGVIVGNWPMGFEKDREVIGNIYEQHTEV